MDRCGTGPANAPRRPGPGRICSPRRGCTAARGAGEEWFAAWLDTLAADGTIRRARWDAAGVILDDLASQVLVLGVTVLELVIRSGLGRSDFRVDPSAMRGRALRAGYHELPVRGSHALGNAALPAIHADPFDRMLLAQARAERLTLLTADHKILQYGQGTAAV